MKDSYIITKFNVRWGFNNIRIREEDQWKGAFITPFRLFEPTVTVCSLGSAMGHPLFNCL